MGGFEVRAAEAEDAEGVSMLVAGMPNSAHIQELFYAAQGNGTAVVAAVQVRARACAAHAAVGHARDAGAYTTT